MEWSLFERDLIGSIWTSPNLERTLAHLCDLCGGRFAGTSDERRAGDFMREQFCAWGLSDARSEPFEMRGWRRGPARLTLMAGDQVVNLPCIALAGSPPGEAEAALVDVGPGAPADFDRVGDALAGKAVLTSAEGPHRLEKYARAQAAGAALFLFANSRPGMLLPAGSLSLGSKPVELPGLGVSLETASFLKRQLKQGPVHVRGAAEGDPHQVTAHNVIADLPGSDPKAGWIVACAHYDGHDIAQGAQDNATGTAVVLEAARAIAPLQAHLKAGIRFILFSGEELGMYGSAAYVREHAAELDGIRAVFNADIVGLAAPLNLMVQNSSELLAYLDQLPLDEIGAQADGSRLVPYSDHFSFTLAGIASLMAVTSSPGPGQGWAHTAADTLDKLDLRSVREAAVSTARILLRMAIDPEGLPAQRLAPESIVQALTAAGIDEPMRVRGEWPF